MMAAQRHALGAALLAVFLGALDLTVIATILPAMVTDLRINAADVDRYVWIVNIDGGQVTRVDVLSNAARNVSTSVGPAGVATGAGSVWVGHYVPEVWRLDPETMRARIPFDKLTPLYPERRLRVELPGPDVSGRVLDLMVPLGKGQRGLIVSPPRTGRRCSSRRSPRR